MSSYSDTDADSYDDSYDGSDDESYEGSHDIKSILEKFEDAVSTEGSVSDETLDIVVNICGMIFTADTVMGSMAAYTSDPSDSDIMDKLYKTFSMGHHIQEHDQVRHGIDALQSVLKVTNVYTPRFIQLFNNMVEKGNTIANAWSRMSSRVKVFLLGMSAEEYSFEYKKKGLNSKSLLKSDIITIRPIGRIHRHGQYVKLGLNHDLVELLLPDEVLVALVLPGKFQSVLKHLKRYVYPKNTVEKQFEGPVSVPNLLSMVEGNMMTDFESFIRYLFGSHTDNGEQNVETHHFGGNSLKTPVFGLSIIITFAMALLGSVNASIF